MVTTEHRFERSPDGSVWTGTAYNLPYWENYLSVFEGVRVIARIKEVESVSSSHHRADGSLVTFAAIPYYIGPWQYLLRHQRVQKALRQAYTGTDALILVNGILAGLMEPLLTKERQPFGVEVIGDPYDVFAPGTMANPLRPFFRWHGSRSLKRLCLRACAVAYVTAEALQRRYPPNPKALSTYFSNIVLQDEDFVNTPRENWKEPENFTLITVGTMDLLYKAQDVLLAAVARCLKNEANIRLVLVGDGYYRRTLASQTQDLGISSRVSFLGRLPGGESVRQELDQAHLFILPSRQEGLPRAMVEAMARSLPCIGSAVGGISELLPAEDMVPPDDANALARKIMEVLDDRNRLSEMSRHNWEKAKEYHNDILQLRRIEFYTKVKEQTQGWLAKKNKT